MPVILMTIGSILALIGFVLLVRAIIGRLISDHPYCRRCRYDLVGLNLSTPTPCPECGDTVLIDSRSVLNGRRKVRYWLLLIALLFLIVGSAGIGYPAIKNHPALWRVDWNLLYEHSPESTLRLYESLGDEEAVSELWQRMNKATLSDKGLRVLIDRAMEHIADPTAQYSHYWGGVLLYALYDNQLTASERAAYIEGSVTSTLHLHASQSNDSDTTYAVITHHGVERFMGSWLTTINLQRKDRPIDSISATSDFVIQCTPRILAINANPPTAQNDWAPTSNDWAAIQPQFATSQIHIPFPIDLQKLDLTIAVDYTLLRNGTIVHQWQSTHQATTHRSDGPFHYAQHIEDPAIINPILSALSIASVIVPTQTDIARNAKHRRNIRPLISFFAAKTFDHTLLGTIRFKLGNDQIPYQTIEWNPKPRTQSPRDMGRSFDSTGGWGWSGLHKFDETIAYYEQYHTFWQQASQIGKVDVLIIPDPTMAQRNPRITSFINRPIIFKDVPISPQIPSIIARTNQAGEPLELLQWTPQNQTTAKPTPINPIPLQTD